MFEECNFPHLFFVSKKVLLYLNCSFFSGPIEPLPFDLSSLWTWSQVKVPPEKKTLILFLSGQIATFCSAISCASHLLNFTSVSSSISTFMWSGLSMSQTDSQKFYQIFPISFKNVNVPPKSNLSFFLLVLCRYEYINVVFFVSHWIAMSNSCYNPFIYAIFSVSYSYRYI